MPPPQPCPICRREGRWLELSSEDAQVNYYRCVDGHVWHLPKNKPTADPTPVTMEVVAIDRR